MLSTIRFNNNNNSVIVNTAAFDNVSINGVITNASLTSTINTISGNVNTISGSLNNLTNYISTFISGDLILSCNNFYYIKLTVFKPQAAYTNNRAFKQHINQILKKI